VCIILIAAQHYQYGGASKGNICSCGSSFIRSEESKECHTKCYGDQNSYCGGDDSKTVVVAISSK